MVGEVGGALLPGGTLTTGTVQHREKGGKSMIVYLFIFKKESHLYATLTLWFISTRNSHRG